MTLIRWWRARAVLGALLGFATSGALCPASAVELVLSDMTYVDSQAGEPGMVLAAERARIPSGGELAHLEGVQLDAAGEDGVSSLILTCDRAVLNLTTSDFSAEGNVRGRTSDGHRFRTEQADFLQEAAVIESRAPVDIIDPAGTRLVGEGFRYSIRSRRMRMRKAVVSEISEEPSE